MIREVQLGKHGVTNNFIQSLRTQFDKVRTVKVSVLSSARQSKADVKKYADEILKRLGIHYTAKCIGFTISLKKWRKVRREE